MIYVSPHCDLDTEDSEPIFLHDTSPHDNTPPYQAYKKKWLSSSEDTTQTRSGTRREYQDKHSLTCWTFAVTLTLNAAIPFFQQDTLAYDAVLSNQVSLQINQQVRRHNRNSHIFIIWALAVTLTLTTVNKFFCMKLWPIMLHYHTRFGSKMFCGSEDITRTNIHWHFEPSLWPWPWMK